MPMSTTRENIKDRNSNMLVIDSAKLESQLVPKLKKEGSNLEKLSKECGYAKGYMSNILHNKVISKTMAYFLEVKYGIKYDDYKYVELPKKVVVEEPKKEEPKELAELIQACIKALNGVEYELISIGRKLDDLKASSELNTEILNDIKDNTSRIKPYATVSKEGK